MEDLWYGKPMSYWHAIARRIGAGDDAYTVNALLVENSSLHAKVGLYEDRIKALMDAFNMVNKTNHSEK